MKPCPDELLERAYHTLDAEERSALDAHARTCPTCALLVRFANEADRDDGAVPPARIARAIDGALALRSRRQAIRAPRGRRTRYMILAAAAVLVAFSAAAAIRVATHTPSSAPPPAITAPEQPVHPPQPQVGVGAHALAIPTASDSAISIEDLPRAAASSVEAHASAEHAETAAELFAAANQSRLDGDLTNAVVKYRRLEDKFPASGEAAIAHVSLARVYDAQGNAAAALAEYDRYLAIPNHKELREDALAGRARACSTLGRGDDEKRAWETLLSEYPDSMYASHARTRLGVPK